MVPSCDSVLVEIWNDKGKDYENASLLVSNKQIEWIYWLIRSI